MSGVKFKIYLVCCSVLTSFEFVSGNPQHPLPVGEKGNAENFVKRAEKELHEAGKISTVIEWAYASNITDYNEKRRLENQVSFCLFSNTEFQKIFYHVHLLI